MKESIVITHVLIDKRVKKSHQTKEVNYLFKKKETYLYSFTETSCVFL